MWYLMVALLMMAVPVQAGRYAVVIGNGAYPPKSALNHLGPLHNPPNDATDMAALLQDVGFTLLDANGADRPLLNASKSEIDYAVDQLIAKLVAEPGSDVVFYYSGHGIYLHDKARPRDSANFLLPVGINFTADDPVKIKSYAVDAHNIKDRLEASSARLKLMILESCRDKLTLTRNQSFGFDTGEFKPMNPVEGMVVVHATLHNYQSWGSSQTRNARFTGELLKALRAGKGKYIVVPISNAVQAVQTENADLESKYRQYPMVEGTPFGEPCLGTCGGGGSAPHITATPLLPLTVRSNVPNGQDQVFIDGELQGSTELVANLPLGIHQVRIVADGYVPWEQQVELTQPYLVYAKLEAAAHKPGQTMRDCDYCPEMVAIPAGSFAMGSTVYDSEQPVHTVHIKAFRMGKYEVTNAQFRKFRPEHNSGDYNGHSLNGDNQPVVRVSWADAVAYTEWLAKETGKPYRLPSEAEWEYAARAGTTTARFWGDNPDQSCSYANVADETAKSKLSFSYIHNCNDGNAVTAPVGSYSPNPWGLYDMLGNVWEWNQDKWHDNYAGAPTDGSAWGAGDDSGRLRRGCSWSSDPDFCRAANRDINTDPDLNYGFRVVFLVAGRAF